MSDMSPVLRGTAAAARWRDAEMKHPPCVICGRPVRKCRESEILCRYIERKTCASPACRKEHHRNSSMHDGATAAPQPIYRRGELVAVDYAGGFGRDTVRSVSFGRVVV